MRVQPEFLNILMLNHNVRGVGTYHRCRYFAKPLVGSGHRVTILTNSKANRLSFFSNTQNGIKIIESPDMLWGQLRSGWDPINALRRIAYLSKEKFDVIHAFDSRPTVILPALFLAKKWKCRLIMDWCDWWGRGGVASSRKPRWLNKIFEPVETFFEENFRKYADHITTISEPLKIRAVELGISEDKVTVVPPVANLDEMYPIDKNSARIQLGLANDVHILIFSSYVQYDLDLLFLAMRKVWQRFPSCLLIITGKQVSKKYQRAPSQKFIYTGQISQEDLRTYIGASDLCLLPLSDNTANRARYPDKLRNYLACGRPVIASEVGETKKLLDAEYAGLLSKPDAISFAETIMSALNSEGKFEWWGAQARKIAETKLAGNHVTDVLEAIYRGDSVHCGTLSSN